MTAVISAAPVSSAQVNRAPISATGAHKLATVTIAVGSWQAALAAATVVTTLFWWPLAEQKVPVQLGWLSLQPSQGVLLLGVAGSIAGSLVHTITIFGSRTGRGTFEASYLWWYLLRPLGAALLGLIFVSTIHSGIVVIGGDSGKNSAVIAYLAGGLAGLFTDAVLQRLRGLLGATSTERKASEQSVPLAPSPEPTS